MASTATTCGDAPFGETNLSSAWDVSWLPGGRGTTPRRAGLRSLPRHHYTRRVARRTVAALSDVQVLHVLGMGLDELLARSHVVPHQDVEDLAGPYGVFDVHPQQDAILGIHGRLPQLLGVHLAQTL